MYGRAEQLRRLADQLATDVGRLRRHTGDGYVAHLVDRLAGHVETLHLAVTPSAAELAGQTYPGDQATLELAIYEVDEAWQHLQARLGKTA